MPYNLTCVKLVIMEETNPNITNQNGSCTQLGKPQFQTDQIMHASSHWEEFQTHPVVWVLQTPVSALCYLEEKTLAQDSLLVFECKGIPSTPSFIASPPAQGNFLLNLWERKEKYGL